MVERAGKWRHESEECRGGAFERRVLESMAHRGERGVSKRLLTPRRMLLLLTPAASLGLRAPTSAEVLLAPQTFWSAAALLDGGGAIGASDAARTS